MSELEEKVKLKDVLSLIDDIEKEIKAELARDNINDLYIKKCFGLDNLYFEIANKKCFLYNDISGTYVNAEIEYAKLYKKIIKDRKNIIKKHVNIAKKLVTKKFDVEKFINKLIDKLLKHNLLKGNILYTLNRFKEHIEITFTNKKCLTSKTFYKYGEYNFNEEYKWLLENLLNRMHNHFYTYFDRFSEEQQLLFLEEINNFKYYDKEDIIDKLDNLLIKNISERISNKIISDITFLKFGG